ncbi:putative reverse transcriptase [Senna tora]|uniref:Putative reverse transcriptase n=1 Tax=Senna tora TaxID=362788 RepID=A0A834U0M3_9FABA|nr:putative reverse transcriptase [Senna tora]
MKTSRKVTFFSGAFSSNNMRTTLVKREEKPFRFYMAWLSDSSFGNLVDEAWGQHSNWINAVILLWKALVSPNKWNEFFSLNFQDWIQDNLTKEWGELNDIKWNTIFGMACWLIWKQRNSCVFSDIQDTAVSLLPKVKAYADLVSNSETPFRSPASKESIEIKWCPPDEDWIKFNSDGSCASNWMSNCGGVLRDHYGNWISGYSKKLGKGDVLHAEAWGAVLGLHISKEKGFKNVHLEVDSLILVKLITKGGPDSQPLNPLISKINSIKVNFSNFKVAHVYREANRLAHVMATHGYSLPYGISVFNRIPDFCNLIFFDDSRGVFFPRGACS